MLVRYVLRRIPSAVVTLLVGSMLIFSLIRLIPGDPAMLLAGPDASPEALQAIRQELGLDRPWPQEYLSWLVGVLTLHPGRSFILGGAITPLIATAAMNTVVLAGTALLLAVGLALALGLASVIRPRRWLDTVVAAFATLGTAVPPFVTGVLAVAVFAVILPVLPAGGTPPGGYLARLDFTAQYLLLPATCLALPIASALCRFLLDAVHTEMGRAYVTTARSLGISRSRIVLTQALPNALPSCLTVLGLQVGHLLGGAVLVEAIFAWPGLGHLIEQAISGRDYPLVQILLLISLAVFVITQVLTDVLHALVDPRIRLGGAA